MGGIGTPAVPSSGGSVGSNVTVTNFPATQPVSGTVTANQGTSPWVDNVSQIGGAAFALGQQLAAASLPVVLTAAQLTTLTPLTSVTVTQATAASLNATVVGTGTFAVQATPVTQADTFMLGGINVKEINAVTPLMGNGTTGTGSLRVTIASDNTAFSIKNQDGAGNALTSNSTATAGKFGLDFNLLSILGTAPTTAGFIDIKGADGNVFVRNATAANFLANVTLQTQTDTVMVGGVNIKEINAVTPLMGNGTTGTGSLRATIASDNTGIANWGHGATGSAVPSGATYHGGQARSSEQAAGSNGNLMGLITDLVGKLIVLPYANPENFVSGRATATDTTSTSLLAAPASGLRNYITQITLWNSSAVSTYIKIQDGSGGTELYDIPAPAGGGATLTLPTPLRQPTTATAIFFAANASANAVFISASGYKGV